MTSADLRLDIVTLTCAVSAGIHGALAPDHFREWVPAGIGFVVATVVLAALAVQLTYRPSDAALVAACVVFVGLILSYALVVARGIPLLHPEQEPVDGLALFTKAVEAVGLCLGASLLRRPSLAVNFSQRKGTLA